MRKRKIKSLISVVACGALLMSVATGCKASDKVKSYFEIEEQEDMLIQETDKIYPSEDLQQDKVVNNSNIDTYMKSYNASAPVESQIEYDAIRFDEAENVYYVYDTDKNAGLKFIVGDYGQIISAKVFTGNNSASGPNLVDMATIALNTFGYSGISDEDKKAIEEITNKKDDISSAIHSNLDIFNGNVKLDISLQDSVNLIEIPAKENLVTDENQNNSQNQMSGTLDGLKNEAQQVVTSKLEEAIPEESTLSDKQELPDFNPPTTTTTVTTTTTKRTDLTPSENTTSPSLSISLPQELNTIENSLTTTTTSSQQ